MISGQHLRTRQGLLPEDDHLAVFEVSSGELRKVCDLPLSSLANVALSHDGWIAGISRGEPPSVICWNPETRTEVTLSLPGDAYPETLAFVEQVLYVGGRNEKNFPFLGLCDFDGQWHPLQVPEAMAKWGKAVDAMVVDEARLLILDNMVEPSWIIEYDVSEPLQPKFSGSEHLQSHGGDETVRAASIGREWIAVLTIGTGLVVREQYVALLDRKSLRERAALGVARSFWAQGPYDWYDVSLLDTLLYIAGGRDGIGFVDLSGLEGSKLDAKTFKKEICFCSLPRLENEKVLRVIPFADYLGVVLEREKEFYPSVSGVGAVHEYLAQEKELRSVILRQQELWEARERMRCASFEEVAHRKNRGNWFYGVWQGGRDMTPSAKKRKPPITRERFDAVIDAIPDGAPGMKLEVYSVYSVTCMREKAGTHRGEPYTEPAHIEIREVAGKRFRIERLDQALTFAYQPAGGHDLVPLAEGVFLMELEGIFARLENRLRARNRRAVKELSVDPNDLRAFVETILPECNERHRNGVLSSAVGALNSPASYLARRRKQLARRGITEPVPNLYVIALVDVLVKLGFAAEIDGNAGYETLFEEVSGLASGRGVNLRGITGASSLGIAEILREFGSDLAAQGYVLAALDVDSDSYVLLVMPEAAYDRSSALAERVAIRMTRF